MKIPISGKLLATKLSIRYKVLVLFAAAIVLPAVFFGIIITSISRQTLRDSIFYRQEEIVSRLADRINAQLDLHLKLLSLKSDIVSLPEAQKTKYIKNIFDKGNAFSEIAILDSKGKEQFRYPKVSLKKKDKRKSDSIKSAVFKNNVSQVFLSDKDNPSMFIKTPISNKNSIVAKLDFKQILAWINEIKIGESGLAFIVDKKGNLIAHREIERVQVRSNFANLPVVKDFINSKGSSAKKWREYYDERNQKVVALYKSIPRLGWAVVTQIPSKEVYEPITNMYNSIIVWTAFWIIIFLFIGLSFVKRIIDPLTLLRSGAEKISKGNLDIKLNIRTGDEIEDLARNFETMAGELKKLEIMKEDLIRMIIHDLKSPLTGIMGSLDYMRDGLSGELSPDQKDMIDLAKRSSENMVVMIQNLLDIAKMEEGKLELKKEKVNVRELLQSRHKEFSLQTLNEQKEISINVQEDLPEIEIEKNLIERVINNLINNAIKHTSSGGKIEISAEREEDFLKITISDNGPGIPKEFKEKIFEKFVQLERQKSQLRTGAGLGLTFCKMAVEAHGGTIWVESEQDKGSSFILTLPLNL
ncbi:MAG: sensor histidine kinase [Elusimicrobia bacterium]|nr:sensor histidine kinase [Elusimicrobiota bacterium]